jgi:hypothetical protein
MVDICRSPLALDSVAYLDAHSQCVQYTECSLDNLGYSKAIEPVVLFLFLFLQLCL